VLLTCCGYYDYDGGYTPRFAGRERFTGPVIHPQSWPEELDYDGKRVVVIGSGATGVTLVPALARRAAHVTMLQRSPSYVVSLPGEDALALRARRHLPERVAYALIRAKNVALMTFSYQLSRRRPRLMRSLIRRGTAGLLPAGFDVDAHFTPTYDPWDQRLCVSPDGDLFAALSDGSASIVTDQIETFTERGIELASGAELEADVIVTATGLRLRALGAITLSLDREPVAVSQRLVYRGMMLSGVPNLIVVLGYTNASWTLRADLTSVYLCRLLGHMRAHRYGAAVAVDDDAGTARRPLIDLSSGYVRRAIEDFPAQGSRAPWLVRQNYVLDRIELARASFDDGVLRFMPATATAPSRAADAVVA
jgi:monooxygenase